MTTESSPQPNPALCWIPGMSGLFDEDVAGDEPLSSAQFGLTKDLDLTSVDVDLLGTLEGKGADLETFLAGQCTDLPAIKSQLDQLLGGTSQNGAPADDCDFLEAFTDLSSYLMDGGDNDVEMTSLDDVFDDSALAGPVGGSSDVVTPVKRSASEAFDELPQPNPDHNDYTSKKRPRLSTVASTDNDDDAASTSSMLSSHGKYRERRRKNNIASRRSRETRKQKFKDMEAQADELEVKNQELRLKIERMERLTESMKSVLIQKLAQDA